MNGPAVRTGLDRLADPTDPIRNRLRGLRVGLLCHAASIDARLRHASAVLSAAGAQVVRLFAPEHGLFGVAQDMRPVESQRTKGCSPPVVSLYGETEETLAPDPRELHDLQALVVDLQDVGSRYYTYVWSAVLAARAASRAGVPVLVLDRPNPLGGEHMEGAPQQEGYTSFVGLLPVPARHGMTIGEVLRLAALSEGWPPGALHVVRMDGWCRSMTWERTGLPWVMPSPNMPTLETARVYPGACLLEGTLLSEGRGTTRPFELWGAPFVDGEVLAEAVRLPGAHLRPLRFQPTFHKHVGSVCGGVQVHVTDPDRFRPLEAYARLLAEVAWRWPDRFAWRTEPYEFVADRPAIDLLTGGRAFREAIDTGRREGRTAGEAALAGWLEAQRAGCALFASKRTEALLYA